VAVEWRVNNMATSHMMGKWIVRCLKTMTLSGIQFHVDLKNCHKNRILTCNV